MQPLDSEDISKEFFFPLTPFK